MSTFNLACIIMYYSTITYAAPSLASSKDKQQEKEYYFPPAEEDYPPIQIPPRGKLPLDSKQMALLEDILPNSELTGQESGKIYGDKLEVQMSSVLHPDNFDNKNKHLSKDPVTNPANYYLHGANLDKIASPSCRLLSCNGPIPNDGSLLYEMDKGAPTENCHQTFIPLNECIGDRGYPVGMVCTICCECTEDFEHEMQQSRGYLEGFNR